MCAKLQASSVGAEFPPASAGSECVLCVWSIQLLPELRSKAGQEGRQNKWFEERLSVSHPRVGIKPLWPLPRIESLSECSSSWRKFALTT